MIRYKLRTLLILLALGPPVMWAAWFAWTEIQSRCDQPPIEYNVGHRLDLDVF